MIKKIFLRILLVFMVVAFLGVVAVQWFWIKNALQEREYRFSTKIYDVLSKAAYRIEQINYVDYMREMRQQLGEIQNYNEVVNKHYFYGTSSFLNEFITNDINRLQQDRSYLSREGYTAVEEKPTRVMTQELIIQSIETLGGIDRSSRGFLDSERLKVLMMKLINERDPSKVSLDSRLANINVGEMLKRFMEEQSIDLDFCYSILDKESLLKTAEMRSGNFYYVPLFPDDYITKEYYLGVNFESIQPLVLGNMGWLFLASGFCIVGLLSVFIVTIFIIMRQQKLSVIKNDFVNNMTHEFKTPLATISLATAAIAKDKVLNDKEQIVKFNDIIKGENKRMNEYVERILQQAKLDRREVYLNKKDTDINKLVEKIASHFILLATEKGGKLELQLSPTELLYNLDEVHMMNAVGNLLDNAIKYSQGAPEIVVYTKQEKGKYIIGVSDNGIGISKEAQRKVFKRFYRVTSGNLHNVKGFGLGLSYVKSIVLLHNGTIRLVSKKNRGTLVEIILGAKS